MAQSYLDKTGLALLWEKIKNGLAGKVDTETGKGLSSNDYTSAEKTKLSGIAAGAQVNVLEGIQVNGSTITPTNKIANIPAMKGATSSAAGSEGVVPKPASGDQVKFLRGDGTWQTPSDTKYTGTSPINVSGTAISHANSGVTAASKGDTSDQTPTWGGTFKVPSGTVNATGHMTAYADHTVKIPDAVATVSNKGLMSAEDAKLVRLLSMKVIDGVTLDEGNETNGIMVHYGECNTAASTATKDVEIPNFVLETGSKIAVKFKVTNSAAVANLKLKVVTPAGIESDAKPIKYRGANLGAAGVLAANRVYEFVYDGTNWEIVGDLDTNTTYTNMSQSEATTGTATSARLISAKVLNDTIAAKINAAQVGAAMFQGTISSNATLTGLSDYKKGWYWVVATAGTYAGQTCEVGDMIFCISDRGTAFANSDFSVVQNNLDIVAITEAEINTICV